MSEFDLQELEELVDRASKSAAEAKDPGLHNAFRALADAADCAHAMLFRTAILSSALTVDEAIAEHRQEGPQEAAEDAEEPAPSEDTPENEEAYKGPLTDEEAAMAERPAFMVRPRSSRRKCSICEQPQWRSPTGWVCKNKHYGAEPLETNE
jgi:hypothetical protein